MSALELRQEALGRLAAGGDAVELVKALAAVDATVEGGLALPADQLAVLAFCAEHEDSSVRFGWAKVLLRRGWKGHAVAPMLNRLWDWSENVPEAPRERRRGAWVTLAAALPDSGLQTPLTYALIKRWRRTTDAESAEAMLALLEGLASVVALPEDALRPLAETVDGDSSAQYRRRCLTLWGRTAISGVGNGTALSAQAVKWLNNGLATAALTRRRLEQVVCQLGDRTQIEAMLAPGDPALDEHVAACLAARMAKANAPAWMARVLAALCDRHRGGGPTYEALLALRQGAASGADLTGALEILTNCWLRLSYDRGPWDLEMDPDLKSELARRSARRDALLTIATVAEQQGDELEGLDELVNQKVASLPRQDMATELNILDQWFGAGAADRARKRLGVP